MRWAFWRWTEVCGQDGTEYLRRLHLLHTPIGSIMLHWIRKPDPSPDMHDHPVAFVSFVLRGGYTEQVPSRWPLVKHWQTDLRKIRRVNVKRPSARHRIVEVLPRTLTLVFAGPKVQEWGYYTGNRNRFVPWKDYQK